MIILDCGVIEMKIEYNALDIAKWFIFKTNSEIRSHVAENDEYEV